jgi:hypothetical protein
MLTRLAERAMIAFIIGFLLGMLFQPAHSRDLGQWTDSDPVTKEWFRTLMQPDNPTVSCCGDADAYYADEIHVKDGKTYVTITDEREDAPLGRVHIAVGTVIEVPDSKLKWDRGNPTGHNILFVLYSSRYVLCFVQSAGI